MPEKVRVIVYSKPGCHLCEEAKAVILSSGCETLFTLTEVNIETDPKLKRKYQYDIPVVAINGLETFMHRVDAREFCGEIQRVSTDYKD